MTTGQTLLDETKSVLDFDNAQFRKSSRSTESKTKILLEYIIHKTLAMI